MIKERVKLDGPPGTGKTQKLISICEDLIAKGVMPWEIIFCSFTRSAAKVARDRAMARFGGTKEDYPWFSTEHSICFRLLGLRRDQVFNRQRLREFGRMYNYEFSGDNGDDTIESRYQEAMLKTVADHYEFFVSYMENRMLPFEDAYREFVRSGAVPDGFTRAGLERYIERRAAYKEENRLWSFGDMIRATLQMGLFPDGVRVLILDEAQDCSRLLWELIRFWSSKVESYYIAGDPLQTIYFWAGSSPELFFEFPGDEEVLSQTHRFGREIKEYAERIVAPTGLPFPEFESAQKASSVSRQSFYSIDWQNIDDAFLLVRTRWLISQIVDYFIGRGIPFVSERGRQSPLATTTGRAFHSLLRLRDGRQVSDTEIKNLVKHTRTPFLERGAKTRIGKLMEGMYHKWELKEMGFTDRFMDALHDSYTDILCQGVDDWEKLYLHKVYERAGIEVFERGSNLVVTTLHASKGREKPRVFLCPDMTDTVWRNFLVDRMPETLLNYVGATRASEELTVLVPQKDYFFPLPRLERG